MRLSKSCDVRRWVSDLAQGVDNRTEARLLISILLPDAFFQLLVGLRGAASCNRALSHVCSCHARARGLVFYHHLDGIHELEKCIRETCSTYPPR